MTNKTTTNPTSSNPGGVDHPFLWVLKAIVMWAIVIGTVGWFVGYLEVIAVFGLIALIVLIGYPS